MNDFGGGAFPLPFVGHGRHWCRAGEGACSRFVAGTKKRVSFWYVWGFVVPLQRKSVTYGKFGGNSGSSQCGEIDPV